MMKPLAQCALALCAPFVPIRRSVMRTRCYPLFLYVSSFHFCARMMTTQRKPTYRLCSSVSAFSNTHWHLSPLVLLCDGRNRDLSPSSSLHPHPAQRQPARRSRPPRRGGLGVVRVCQDSRRWLGFEQDVGFSSGVHKGEGGKERKRGKWT